MKIKLKKIFILLLSVFSLISIAEEPFKAELFLDSSTASVGEHVRVTVQINRSGNPIFDLPKIDNARWISQYRQTSSSTRIINGKRSVNTAITIAIYPEKVGTIQIPSFKVKCGKEEAKTNPVTLKIVPPQERVSASSNDDAQNNSNTIAATGKISIPKGRYTFYTGEEIPLIITLDIPLNLPVAQLSYPTISNLDNALFTDYAKVNPENKRFAQPSRQTILINGIRVNRFTFRTSFRILKPGNYTPEAKTSLGIRTIRRQSSMFDDDFFDGFFNSGASIVNKTLSFKKLPQPIVVKALPPAPVNIANTNLIGSWLGTASLSSNSAKVGEPLELTLEYTGIGAVDLFTAPEIKLNDFRIYPPEIKKSPGVVQVKYALIPLNTGEKTISIKTCAFDSEKGKYEIFPFSLSVAIAKGNITPSTSTAKVVAPSAITPPAKVEKATNEEKRDELFYQKANPGKFVFLPLVNNNLITSISLVLLGIILVFICEYIRLRNKRKLTDKDFSRSKELKKLYKTLEQVLSNPNSNETTIREAATEYFSTALRLNQGATPEDIAQNIKDDELKTFFTSLNTSGFAPTALQEGAFTVNKLLAKKILKAAKKLSILVITFFAISAFGNESFNAEFDKGNLPAAIQNYKKYIHQDKISPNALYNLGATYYRMDNLPLAKLCFERALLLKPTDYETLENLNLVNRKLLQNETGNVDSFSTLLTYTRDRLRPDQYLLIISFMFLVLCIIFVLRTKLGLTGTLTALALPCFIILTSLACIISQVNTSYNPNKVIVVEKTLELKTLPATSSGRVIAQIPGGNIAKVIEYKDNWARIEVNGQDGWAKRSAIEPIFPGKIF